MNKACFSGGFSISALPYPTDSEKTPTIAITNTELA